MGDGLFTSEGAVWRRQRKLMAPLFQPAHLAGYANLMTSAAARCASGCKDGATIDIARESTRITMDIVGKALFDANTFDEAAELGDALTVMLAWAAERAMSLGLFLRLALQARVEGRMPRLAAALDRPIRLPERQREALRTIDARVERMIADRRARPEGRDDLLTRLLRSHDETGVMTDVQLRDEVVTLFVAGHETTATALAWAFYLLARNPAIDDAVQREALDYVERPIERHGLPDLPLCLRVFSESLRMYPPVPVYEREALQAVELAGQKLRAGDMVAVFPWALHHRPEIWPDPDRFDPSRFEEENLAARSRHAYLPFGVGPRVCLGAHFANLEGALVLATVLRQVRLELLEPGRDVLPDPKAATTRPLGGIPMRVRRR